MRLLAAVAVVLLAASLAACGVGLRSTTTAPVADERASVTGSPEHFRAVLLANQDCYERLGSFQVEAAHSVRSYLRRGLPLDGPPQRRTERYDFSNRAGLTPGLVEATSHPTFSQADTLVVLHRRGDTTSVRVGSASRDVRHFFDDLIVHFGPGDAILAITGRVNIHGYSYETRERSISWRDDYNADYLERGGCYFPRTIHYYAPADTSHIRPRVTVELAYDLPE